MNAPGTVEFTWPELSMLAVHWLSLWLGFYLLSRRPRTAAGACMAGTCIALSTYFLSSAYLASPVPVPGSWLWGVWIGGWIPLAPAFLVHAFLELTGRRLPWQRLILVLLYGAGVAAFALGISDTLVYRYTQPVAHATENVNGLTAPGPLYPLFVAQMGVTLIVALLVLVRARRARPAVAAPVRSGLDLLIAGTSVMVACAALLFIGAFLGLGLVSEAGLYPLLAAATVLVAVPYTRYAGLVDGQLLRTDLWASLLGAALLMTAFAAVVLAAGGSFRVLAGLGWLVLAVFVFADDLRGLTDRAVYRAGGRAGRDGLRTAARYAGGLASLDLASLVPQQHETLLELLGQMDRAEVAATRLGGARDPRLDLLSDEEFAPVRSALGLGPGWESGAVPPLEAVRRHAAGLLRPRERQALGLRHLGYSDRQMAELMHVKMGVPRSYLADARRKLGLTAGAQLMLFVHFSGLVEQDALPLLTPRANDPGSTPLTTDDTPASVGSS